MKTPPEEKPNIVVKSEEPFLIPIIPSEVSTSFVITSLLFAFNDAVTPISALLILSIISYIESDSKTSIEVSLTIPLSSTTIIKSPLLNFCEVLIGFIEVSTA